MKVSKLLIIFFLTTCFVYAKDEQLLRAVKFVNKSLDKIPQGLSESCPPQKQERACPKVLKRSFEDIYRQGTAGTINTIVSDGSLKNPRTVCSTSAETANKVSLSGLNEQLNSNFKEQPQLFEYTQACAAGRLQKADAKLAQVYMAYDFNYKSEAIKNAMNDLLDSQAQIQLLMPASRPNCYEIQMVNVKNRCLELNQCKPSASAKHYMDIKTEEVSLALNGINKLNQAYQKLMNGTGRLSSANRQKANLIKEDIERIKDMNPLLRGEKFKRLLNVKSSPQEIQAAIKGQLNISQNEIHKKLKEFNGAYQCLIGSRQQCDDFDKVISQSKYRVNGDLYLKQKDLSYASTFHQCTENIKEARNSADVILNDAGINLALTLTPYAIVNGVKLAATMARTASITSKVTRTENLTAKAGLAANMGYGGYHNINEFNQCQSEIKLFQKLGASQKRLSCNSMDRILVNNSNNSRCITQALISAALMTPMAAESLRLARHLPKVVLPQAQINALTSKIRSGASLTKAEELLLLAKLKEKNPLEKLMVRGLSANDKKFASTTLDKLYLQQDVSPEDLLKLSKLIKQRNPPLLIVTRQDNVDDIMKSGKIWGSTEGSVYAAAKPAETKWDKLKTGVHGDKEGTFIFTPEAAGLFKPHEITGLYSAIKRAAGQYKGPFGDIVIEEAKKTMVNGRPHIIVTKARRAGAPGETLHAGQKTSKAAARLTGRRVGLDPLFTGTGVIVSIQAASTFTGVSVNDILLELFQKKSEP
ncbi:MAG: hypothetical protein NDI69_11555 [Bacteriovoracaceae bacterium]|nr:hypothetical protein [Bacteriovoracaceae bacterium]